ncbi:MAG: DEAD/DEAH box helicase, partial [Spirochaetales bacterium]
MSAFARLDPLLQEKIVSNLGWTSLRAVQELTTDAILDGKNCIVLAPTAGGKTEAAIFPILSACLSSQESGLRVLYVCPTRALLNNQEERLSHYTSMVGMGAFKWHGDVTPSRKKQFLREPCEFMLTTPESLEVMLDSENVPTAKLFHNLSYVVVDEIHALASCDRGSHLLCILERIRAHCPHDFQRIGLSATIGNLGHIMEWLQGSSTNPCALIDPPKTTAKKNIAIQLALEPGEMDLKILSASKGLKSLLFCESRRLAERISGILKKTGEPVFVHHSSLRREEREESERQFSQGTEACIVCTSTMELGIDVGDLDKVLQINAPGTVSSFLQRMGRTGRRSGTTSNTTFFIEKEEYLLQAIAIVELARSHWVENVKTTNQAWHILLHQIMALCLERGGITTTMPWKVLGKAHCFSGIHEAAFTQFINFLISKDFLHDDGGGTFSMGLEAEKAFGRKNFMELYSVFSSPTEFEVVSLSGDPIGSVEWDFLEKLLDGKASFYLAGKAWTVERIEWKKKLVFVARAPAGKIPRWGGISPHFLGYELCRKERDTLV